MPFVRVSALEDEINVFWRSNLPKDNIDNIANTTRPTLVILNFTTLSVDFLDKQFQDPAFLDHNLFAFDLPGFGRTECPLLTTPKQLPLMDEWVMAAILADFCLHLNLPPVHVWAPAYWSTHIACRFAALFPALCRSIILSSVGQPITTDDYRETVITLTSELAGWKDPEVRDECLAAIHYQFFSENPIPEDERDSMHAHWVENFTGRRATSLALVGSSWLEGQPFTRKHGSFVEAPVVIIQGDNGFLRATEDAYKFATLFTNTVGDVEVEIVHGAPPGYVVMSEFARAVNHVVCMHLDASHLITPTAKPHGSRNETMKATLKRLAIVEDRPDIANRSERSVFSFCVRSPEMLGKFRKMWLEPFLAIEQEAKK